MVLRIDSSRVFRIHLGLIVSLGAAHLFVWLAQSRGHAYLRGFGPMFNMNRENNFPSLFSGLALFLAGVLMFETARRVRPVGASRMTFGWILLGAAFVFLAIDEVMALHEQVHGWLPQGMQASGRWHYAWVGPYVLGALLLGALLFHFWWNLPPLTRGRLAIAGAVFILGAAGLEVVAGYLGHSYGRTSVIYGFEVWLEESMEMAGVALLVRAVLDFNLALETDPVAGQSTGRWMGIQHRRAADRRRDARDRRGSGIVRAS